MPDKGQSKYPSMNVYPRVSLSGQYSLSWYMILDCFWNFQAP
jgi:hypothetical protein